MRSERGSIVGGGSVEVLMKRSLGVDRMRSLGLPSMRGSALDAIGDAGRLRCSILWPPRNLPLLTDFRAQSCDQLACSLSAQVELGDNAVVGRRVHEAVDVNFDVLGGPCFCAPSFLESERPEVNLGTSIASRDREPSGTYSAINIKKKEPEKAVDAGRDRSASRVVKARRADEEMEERTQVYNFPTSEVEELSACHRNIRREQYVQSISQRSPRAFNCTFLINFALVRLKHQRHFAIRRRNNGQAGLLTYRGERRYWRFKRSNVEVLPGCGEAATARTPIRFATLSNPLLISKERAFNG